MRYIVKSYKPNKGKSKDRATGNEYSWDKVDFQCVTKDERPNAVEPVGELWREVLSVPNSFATVVITNGFPVTCFDDLRGCEVTPLYNRWGKVEALSVVAVNAKF